LYGTNVAQTQDSIATFCEKIAAGNNARVTGDFIVIARIESLILDAGTDDALERAAAYLDAGAYAIMIHSKAETPDEIFEFCKRYHGQGLQAPLVVVPSTYDQVTEQQLIDAGVRVVIYANHLLRASYPAMVRAAESILRHGRAHEAAKDCMSIKEILSIFGGDK